MEQKLNRKLRKGETVHHIDCDPTNDDINNLYVFQSKGMHTSSHCTIYKLTKSLLQENIIKFVDGKYERV